jgi:hypothetical protein
MQVKMLYRLVVVVARLIVVLGVGCASPTRPDVAPIVLRFIADDPEQSFMRGDLLEERQVFSWPFRTRRDLSLWRLGFLEKSFPDSADYAVLTSIRRMPRLYRRINRTAETIDMFRLIGEGLRHEVAIHWHAPGERHANERVVRAEPRITDRHGTTQWDFAMASHPLWTGPLKELRMDPVALPKQQFQLHQLIAIKFQPIPDRLKAANGGAWKVDLKRDVRNAVLIPPGHSVERELLVPDDATLHFACGLQHGPVRPRTAEPIRFRIAVARAAGEASTVFEDTIDSTLRGSSAPGWKDGLVDLTAYAGERVRLILETSANESWEPWHGFTFWANPEVTRRKPRIAAADETGAEPSPPNVVLISIDTLRADRLSLYGHDRRTSPNIDKWARRAGVTFQNAIVQAPWTLPSHVSIFTSRWPLTCIA